MRVLLWVVTIISSCIGGIILLFTLVSSSGAPQEAAGAAIAIAFTVIPYCIARAYEKLRQESLAKVLERVVVMPRPAPTQVIQPGHGVQPAQAQRRVPTG